MYKVLIVDDEMPALRFLQAIVEKYAPDFTVEASCSSGGEALTHLKKGKIDLLLTDISMPIMDGIALSLKARELQSDIHIVIVTGYADFEYAKGAIQAAVDDYILKPVSVTHMTEALQKIKEKLDEDYAAREPALLCALLGGKPYDALLAAQLYGTGRFCFALVRWGNLDPTLGKLLSTSRIPLPDAPFFALNGRDEDEQLIFSQANQPATAFQTSVKSYMSTHKASATWTVIFSRNAAMLSDLQGFYLRAAEVMKRSVVIGRHQCAYLSGSKSNEDKTRHLSNATIKKLEYFILEGDTRMIKNTFISLAAEWENARLPQLYAATMVQQLTHLVLSTQSSPGEQQDALLEEVEDLLRYAVSYGDLMAGLYSVLFDGSPSKDKRLSTEELYTYAIHFIQEKYTQPISIQNVCTQIGISQTYLSRLFRKHGNTSFSAYLTQYRLNAAMKMIREHPDVSLKNVAACVGYDDYAYFSRVFHQIVGCTPSQWAANPENQAYPPA